MKEFKSAEPILDQSELPDIREVELPRWVQVPAGIILSLFTLLCGLGSAYLLLVPNKQAPILAFVVGFILLAGCLWVLAKCFRLITGKKTKGGLLSPNGLRVLSVFVLMLPAVGLFTGYYRRMGAVALYQAVIYFFVFMGLRALASRREANVGMKADEHSHAQDH